MAELYLPRKGEVRAFQIRMPVDLRERIEHYAGDTGLSLHEVVLRLISFGLDTLDEQEEQ